MDGSMEGAPGAENETLVADDKVRAAWLYYVEGLTQEQIAETLGLNRIKIIRMLAAARTEGLIRIRIDGRAARQVALERGLIGRFGLAEAVVVPRARDPDSTAALVGHAAGTWLSDRLRDGLSVAVGWGQTLHLALRGMQPRPIEGMSVVSLLGGLTHSRSINPSAVARRVADLFGADCFQLTAPVFVAQPEIREALWREPTLRELRDRARAADIALVSVGDVQGNATLFREGLLPRADLASLRKAHAVGDLLCHFIDAEGRLVDHPVNRRVMAVSPADLAGIGLVAIAAGGADKEHAIRAALRASAAKALITDESAAEALLADA
ncbi:sugar-binding transcriptional regulator [Bosea sp. (in: a-proteobacteria)]|uniref:sugar-binding transcriptional regulator n=1 Tax=Bosea sp. (in: a-proteobacteria) TaxID=1871050 RepID=UPI0026243D5D|nr:sugar-binding transcriptional regulator [Bosea sp. (in: a-proteobacteria)]MCO5090310.1 sugar-binding transcriptional regulator [Bosea sp. (in: a-proteobacteria)]